MYRLECSCGNPISVTPRQAGSIVVCDRCSREVPVPKLGQLRQLPRTEETSAAPVPPGRQGLGAVRGTIFALCLLLFAVAGTVSVVAATKAFFQELPPTPQQYIEQNRDLIDQMRPVDLLETWREYEGSGLGEKIPPPFYRERLRIERWRIVFWVAAGVTLLAAVGLFLSGRRTRRPAAG